MIFFCGVLFGAAFGALGVILYVLSRPEESRTGCTGDCNQGRNCTCMKK